MKAPYAKSMAFLATLFAWSTCFADLPETLLLQDPDVSNSHVAFVYAQDLWVCARDGGTARRLTSDVGSESRPRFSPDGQWIAFTAQYHGNTDVYVMSVAGGLPKRLTWHPGRDYVQDWTPDGKHILFASGRYGGAPVARLFKVALDGGSPIRLPLPKVAHASMNKAGTHIAYTPIPDAFRSWKRYRGGRTTPIWIYDVKTHEVEEIPHLRATDTFPAWLNGTVYFASDRLGIMNMWSFRPGDKKVRQMTHFKNFDIRNLSTGGGLVVYEQAGALHLYNPKTDATKRLRIHVPTDGLMAKARWQSVNGFVRSASISPEGKRAVFEARGEIISLPREHGHARHLTKSSDAHDRTPRWSPDGRHIAWFSDQNGEYQLFIQDHKGRKKPRVFDLESGGFYYSLEWSPDSKHLAYTDKTGTLSMITPGTKKITIIATSHGTLGVYFPNPTWSPDSRWIAFEQRNPQTTYDHIALYDTKTNKIVTLTDRFSSAENPVFSRDGKYLFFTASINSGPRRFGLDMGTSAAKPSSRHIYFAVLSKKTKNPLAPQNDEATVVKKTKAKKSKKADKKADKKKAKDSDAVKPTVIDLAGLDQRILALPIPSGLYGSLQCDKSKLYYLNWKDGALRSFDFKTKKSAAVSTGVRSYRISADGKNFLIQSRKWSIMKMPGKASKPLPIESTKVYVDPKQEWHQMLRETWRLQRDYFYDENMHGVDWPAMWGRWQAFLPHVRHRSDLSLLMKEMIGELCCGHEYVSGGDLPRADSGISVGLLGADYKIDQGRYKIAQIYKGQNWNPGLRSPLTEPGIKVAVGNYLLAINGEAIDSKENLYRYFENTAGKVTELKLSKTSDGKKSWTIQVVPLSSDSSLRSLDWIERNRKRVQKLSKGRLAYVYMPDTGGRGMASFDRDFYSQIHKEGLIIDERYNRGGKVADYVISVLSRKPYCYWMNREKWLGRTPFATMTGPKVMVINERAGSGGDAMPWMFKNNKLGPLVGTRTWGGLVGISGYPVLIDGGRITAASFGVMDVNGKWAVENEGVSPDYEVVEKPKDIIEGRDPQLDKAIELAMEALKKTKKKRVPSYYPPKKR